MRSGGTHRMQKYRSITPPQRLPAAWRSSVTATSSLLNAPVGRFIKTIADALPDHGATSMAHNRRWADDERRRVQAKLCGDVDVGSPLRLFTSSRFHAGTRQARRDVLLLLYFLFSCCVLPPCGHSTYLQRCAASAWHCAWFCATLHTISYTFHRLQNWSCACCLPCCAAKLAPAAPAASSSAAMPWTAPRT